MGQYTSYWLYQRYEQRGSQDPIPTYPNVYSVDADGTMPLVVRNEDDTECGYVPPVEPIYRWANIPITQDYICDECNVAQYRWVNLDPSVDYYCEGTTKYYKQKRQVSYDGGVTWQDVVPAEYQKGGVAETESTDCGYVPPTPTTKKLVATYTGSTTREVECNSSGTLTTSETKPSGYQASAMTSAVIGQCVITIGEYAFYGCKSLISVTIPNSVTTIGNQSFQACSGLTSVNIPDGVTNIGSSSFWDCTSLTAVSIPNSVTRIDRAAFGLCGLINVTIGSGITYIGSEAFNYNNSITSVTCLATTPPTIGDNIFRERIPMIYVPSQSVSAYKSASGWSTYASRIQAIP